VRLLRSFASWLVVLATATIGCQARDSSVRMFAPGDMRFIYSQPVPAVYFVPFDTSAVVMSGDHGDAPKAAENKGKWFSHVVAGAQLAFNDSHAASQAVLVTPVASPYDRDVMGKLQVVIGYSPVVPPNAFVVTGRYLESDNVGGGVRFLVGSMGGKTFTRAHIRIARGPAIICDATVDGTYLGGGYSWGYETLGANEALGRAIVEIVQKLQTGQPVEMARSGASHTG
jgi:hypothetical protein